MSSSRRAAAADDNILARLERDARRSKSGKKGWTNAPLAWCLLASVAVVGLVGTLASLTRENMSVNRSPVLIDASVAPADVSGPSGAAIVKGGFAPLPVPDLKLAAAAKPVEPLRPPPMVMLKPAPEAPAKVAAPRAPAPRPAAKAAPVRTAAAPKSAPSVKPAPPARSAPARTVVARPAPVRTVLAAAPPRPKKAAPAPAVAAPEPAAIDSDVALLSAIIVHASRHAAERAQQEAARCGAGRKCPLREDAVTTSLKATD